MDVRAQVSVVFHLDKCIGCHTCSVSCKNVWTDRAGAEYMWWNNVETKPGTGYPSLWEDQDHYRGGWKLCGQKNDQAQHGENARLELLSQNKLDSFIKLFYNPNQPGMDDYYEPWTYEYGKLLDAPAADVQPIARALSQVTGEYMNIEAGPNWDDDLSGSPLYAANDVDLTDLSESEREQLFEIERVCFFHLPRICNHCTNPSCVASCPSGALYKRGEDGIVLVNQETCQGWRACVTACPYKKTYYNWKTGKSEKCILCYPKLETGQIPNCFQSCVGRIRYLGVLLYDASRVADCMKVSDHSLVESQRSCILDPFDQRVIQQARENGVADEMIEAAQRSPVYNYVMKWKLALPLHVEFRTMPMLFYVPPLLPVMGRFDNGRYDNVTDTFFSGLAKARIPMKYLARLFSAGNLEIIESVMKKLMAVRYYKRALDLGKAETVTASRMMREGNLTSQEAEEIYAMTALATIYDRFAIPPFKREEAIEETLSPELAKGSCGLGLTEPPGRGP